MNRTFDMNDEFKSSDFVLVATLHSLNYKFERIEREAGGKVVFVFSRNAYLDTIVEKYQCGDLCVEPQRLAYSQKFLKTIIRAQ